MQRFETTKHARSYDHAQCGGQTTIGGGDLFDVCNPFQTVTSAMCACCVRAVPLDSVSWSDTGEDLVSYRKRLRQNVPLIFRWADSNWTIPFCLAFAAAGAGVAMLLFPGNDLAWKVPGVAALIYGGGVPFVANIWITFAKFTQVI